MFEKLAHIVLPSFLLLAFGISAATETPAARSESAPAEISYLCQLADGRSVAAVGPAAQCVVRAQVGNFSSLTSNNFSVVGHGG